MNTMPKRYRWLLLLSLALNLGLGAALMAHHWHLSQHQGSGERRWARLPDARQLTRALDEPDRAVLRKVMESHREALGSQFQPMGDARREVAEALRAEPFDPDALTRAFARIRDSEGNMANAMHAFMLDLATQVSAQGRQRIADRMERSRHRHGGERRQADSERDGGKRAESVPAEPAPENAED